MKDRAAILRETDDEALALARTLLRSARHATIAVVDPKTGDPLASRVLMGTDIDGVPVVLVSALSLHTTSLAEDGRASLLTGEPGKGDPLAHPRLTTQCRAAVVDRTAAAYPHLRRRFLARHPKAALYVDFPDFRFFRLVPEWASLNGGFGRAYRIDREHLVIASPANHVVAEHADEIERRLLHDFPDLAQSLAASAGQKATGRWRIAGLDCAGIDIARGDFLLRCEMETLAIGVDDIYSSIAKIADVTPKT